MNEPEQKLYDALANVAHATSEMTEYAIQINSIPRTWRVHPDDMAAIKEALEAWKKATEVFLKETEDQWIHPLYEYTTRTVPYEGSLVLSSSFSTDKDLEEQGWRRVWADVTTEGTFLVYRRIRKGATTGRLGLPV